MTGVIIKSENMDEDIQEECHVRMEAEIRVMALQPR